MLPLVNSGTLGDEELGRFYNVLIIYYYSVKNYKEEVVLLNKFQEVCKPNWRTVEEIDYYEVLV